MTIQAWLDQRQPPPPAALAKRVAEFASAVHVGTLDAPSACLRAAELALHRLVRDGDAGRASALDLLAIDALVTYAFEAAADTPDGIDTLAHDAMVTLSRVASR